MRRRRDEAEDERDAGEEQVAPENGDLGAMLLGAQAGGGNQALAAVDFKRRPLAERTKKAILERVAVTKPGMLLYAREDFETLMELDARLTELRKRLDDNAVAVTTARAALGAMSEPATAHARSAALKLAGDAQEAALILGEVEHELQAVADRHARANAADREQLNKLMEGLEPRYRREAHNAMASGASRQEIDYLVKKAWLEQHEATQKLAKDELWQLVTGFSPRESTVCYFDLPQRMAQWRIHFSLEYSAMRAVGVESSDGDIRDALLGRGAAVVTRSHATAEVFGRDDDRNPRYYYAAGRVTPKREFWETREGKAAKRNWSANQGRLIAAFEAKADALVKVVHEVLVERRELKALVVKAGESLEWAE